MQNVNKGDGVLASVSFNLLRCCRCGEPVFKDGWCMTCRLALGMQGPREKCLTKDCTNHPNMNGSFCNACILKKVEANGENRISVYLPKNWDFT
jgi:hypothetical protein